MLYKHSPREMEVGCFFIELKTKEYIYLCFLKAILYRLRFLSFDFFLQFPSHLHSCTFSSLFSISMLPAFLLLSLPYPPFFLTPLFFYYSHPSPILPLLPCLCLFNSVTVSHTSNPDTFFSLWPCCRAVLADSTPQPHNARAELSRQASKCTNPSLKRR